MVVKLLNKDFRDGMAELPNNSIDLIFTDPPYARQYEYIWSPLASEAKRVLKPGGSLITLTGIVNLPFVISTLSDKLDYFWCCAMLHKEIAEVRSVHMYNAWKPILWFAKGEPTRKPLPLPDGVSPFGAQKNDHRWQQAEEWAEHFIDYVVPSGGLVVDPFLGSGTTGLVCTRLGFDFIGIDIDPDAIRVSERRIHGKLD